VKEIQYEIDFKLVENNKRFHVDSVKNLWSIYSNSVTKELEK